MHSFHRSVFSRKYFLSNLAASVNNESSGSQHYLIIVSLFNVILFGIIHTYLGILKDVMDQISVPIICVFHITAN